VLPVDDVPIVRVREEFCPSSANSYVNGAVLDAHEKCIGGGDAERSVGDAGDPGYTGFTYVDEPPFLANASVVADGAPGDAGGRV